MLDQRLFKTIEIYQLTRPPNVQMKAHDCTHKDNHKLKLTK